MRQVYFNQLRLDTVPRYQDGHMTTVACRNRGPHPPLARLNENRLLSTGTNFRKRERPCFFLRNPSLFSLFSLHSIC